MNGTLRVAIKNTCAVQILASVFLSGDARTLKLVECATTLALLGGSPDARELPDIGWALDGKARAS